MEERRNGAPRVRRVGLRSRPTAWPKAATDTNRRPTLFDSCPWLLPATGAATRRASNPIGVSYRDPFVSVSPFLCVMPLPPSSPFPLSRFEPDARGERLGDHEFAVDDLERQRRQRTRRRTVDHLRAVFRIERRRVTRTREVLIAGQPIVDVAAIVRT